MDAQITASYAERLLEDLDLLDWPENLRRCNVIGLSKSEGL